MKKSLARRVCNCGAACNPNEEAIACCALPGKMSNVSTIVGAGPTPSPVIRLSSDAPASPVCPRSTTCSWPGLSFDCGTQFALLEASCSCVKERTVDECKSDGGFSGINRVRNDFETPQAVR